MFTGEEITIKDRLSCFARVKVVRSFLAPVNVLNEYRRRLERN